MRKVLLHNFDSCSSLKAKVYSHETFKFDVREYKLAQRNSEIGLETVFLFQMKKNQKEPINAVIIESAGKLSSGFMTSLEKVIPIGNINLVSGACAFSSEDKRFRGFHDLESAYEKCGPRSQDVVCLDACGSLTALTLYNDIRYGIEMAKNSFVLEVSWSKRPFFTEKTISTMFQYTKCKLHRFDSGITNNAVFEECEDCEPTDMSEIRRLMEKFGKFRKKYYPPPNENTFYVKGTGEDPLEYGIQWIEFIAWECGVTITDAWKSEYSSVCTVVFRGYRRNTDLGLRDEISWWKENPLTHIDHADSLGIPKHLYSDEGFVQPPTAFFAHPLIRKHLRDEWYSVYFKKLLGGHRSKHTCITNMAKDTGIDGHDKLLDQYHFIMDSWQQWRVEEPLLLVSPQKPQKLRKRTQAPPTQVKRKREPEEEDEESLFRKLAHVRQKFEEAKAQQLFLTLHA